MPAVVRLRNLTDAQLFDRQSRKLRGFMNTGLRNLHDCLRDHFRQGVVAILDAEGVQRLLVSFCDKADGSPRTYALQHPIE
jgi:hypothetical protein